MHNPNSEGVPSRTQTHRDLQIDFDSADDLFLGLVPASSRSSGRDARVKFPHMLLTMMTHLTQTDPRVERHFQQLNSHMDLTGLGASGEP